MIKKIFDISDDEKKLFQEAMSDFQKISDFQRAREQERTASTTFPFAGARVLNNSQNISNNITADTQIHFARSGLQHKLLNQLRQGKLKINATLDLHQLTIDQATTATDIFLQQCSSNNKRVILIIHGKGNLSQHNIPVLKNFINSYLRSHPLVLAFYSAKNKHGGTGAVYALVKI